MDAVLEKRPDAGDADYWQQVYDMKPAILTISRNDPADVQQRQVIVSLDGQRLGDLLYTQTLTREIAPGPHRVPISNTLFWKTFRIVATPGERIRFEVVNRAGRLTYPLMVVMGVGPLYLTVRRVA